MNSLERSAVIYVWDNAEQKLAGLYRAVRPEDLDRECAAGFNGYFTPERLDEFVSGLYETFGPRQVAVREWLASSSEDFHATRLGWTKEEFEKFGPKVVAGGLVPSPLLKVGEQEWDMRGVEFLNNTIGMPAGIPVDQPRVIEAMKAYLERRRIALIAEWREEGLETNSEKAWPAVISMMKEMGYRTHDSASDVPMRWNQISALDRLGALQLLDGVLENPGGRLLELTFPHRDRELYEAAQKGYCKKFDVRLHSDPNEPRYYYQIRDKNDLVSEWWIGTHRDEILRTFGPHLG